MKSAALVALFACVLAIQAAPSSKIINGGEVVPYSLPWMVSIQVKTGNTYVHSCAGTILDVSTILTSAGCVNGISVRNLQVVAAEHSLGTVSGEEEIRTVVEIRADAAYDANTNLNDIAILKLTTPLVLTTKVQPVVLPPTTAELDPPAGLEVQIAGWGDTVSVNGTGSDVLIGATVPVVSDSDCNLAYGGANNTVVFDSMMCTAEGAGGACVRDIGGALYTGTGVDAVIHGIISWGVGCGDALYPDVYTQVSYFLDWIAANRG